MATKTPRVTSSKWFVRIDGQSAYLTQKLNLIQEWVDVSGILATYHIGSKKEHPHIHFIIDMYSVLQKQSFDIRIKKLFEIETARAKASCWSSKPWDGKYGEGAGSYLFHEELDGKPLVQKGFTDEDVTVFRQAAKTVDRVVKLNQEKASFKLVDAAVEYYGGTHVTERDVGMFMCKRVIDGTNHYPGSFMMKKFIEEAMLKLQGEHYAHVLLDKILR